MDRRRYIDLVITAWFFYNEGLITEQDRIDRIDIYGSVLSFE